MLGLGEEVREHAAVELLLADLAPLQQFLAAIVERAVQESEEGRSLLGQDASLIIVDAAVNGDALEELLEGGHFGKKDGIGSLAVPWNGKGSMILYVSRHWALQLLGRARVGELDRSLQEKLKFN
jgi:hypothetical protein